MFKKILTIIIIVFALISCNNNQNQNQNNNEQINANQNSVINPFTTNADGRIHSKGIAAVSKNMNFTVREFTRHPVGENDILIEILYAGICHSDIHSINGDHGEGNYPLVAGHEIAGRVVQVGSAVTKFKVGDYAGVGCMVNSCGECVNCLNNQEQFCLNMAVYTYDSVDRFHDNEITQGGYSDNIVVSEKFAISIPSNAQIEKVAPLLCAGITTYSPIQVMKIKKGDKVGIAGYGGLGHMAVQYTVKLGADVTVFDITEDKRQDALNMGAVRYVNVNNPSDLQNLDNTLDYIISAIPARYDLNMYMGMLKRGGEMAVLGLPPSENNPSLNIIDLAIINGSRKIFGSLIGGIKETQEMLNYSVANDIYPEVKIINAEPRAVEEAYRNVIDGKVKFRYVIDMKTLN